MVTVMLFIRFAVSAFSEYLRVRYWKWHFLDQRQAFNVLAITRYIFLVATLLPVMIIVSNFLEFKGTMVVIISSILVFQELVVFVIVIFKIKKSKMSKKLKFINKRYGEDIDRKMYMLKCTI